MRPLVSVMMITYNHAPYIARGIESVLAQKTDFPFELVIGEDCSTDDTREIVFDYQRRFPDKVRVITSERNVGATRNSVRTHAALRGKYMAWCEGDDFWHRDDKLQQQAQYLENHEDCVLVCSDYDRLYVETGERVTNYFRTRRKPPVSNPRIEDLLHGHGGILTCTAMSRLDLVRSITDADPFLHKSGHFKMGDTQLWAELLLHGRAHRFEESFATRGMLPESATRSRDPEKEMRFWLSNSELCVYLCRKHNLGEELVAKFECAMRRRILQLALFRRDNEMGESFARAYQPLYHSEKLWLAAIRYPAFGAIFSLARRIKQLGKAGLEFQR